MTVSHCIGPAMREASRDPSKTADVVNKQPETCPHADCTAPNCKQACAGALRPPFLAWRARARANGQGD